MPQGSRPIWIGIAAITSEKALQHLFTAVVLIVAVPGLDSPDLGRAAALGEPAVAALNAAVAALFAIALYAALRKLTWHRPLLLGLAAFDVTAELVLHEGLLITVSLVLAVGLLILLKLDADANASDP